MNRVEEMIDVEAPQPATAETLAAKMLELKNQAAQTCLAEINVVLAKHKCKLVPIHAFVGVELRQSVSVELA